MTAHVRFEGTPSHIDAKPHIQFDENPPHELEAPLPRVRSETVFVNRVSNVMSTNLRKSMAVVMVSALFTTVSVLIIVLSRPMGVQSSAFVGPDGRVIGTGALITSVEDLASLPARGQGGFAEFDEMKTILAEDSDDGARSLRITSWQWFNYNRMTFATDQGTVLISNNNIQMSGPRDAVIRFKESSGEAYSAGSGQHTDEAVQKLKEHCDKIRCDESIDGTKSYHRCSGSFDSSNGLVNDASCDEAVLWRWPEGVELSDTPANRRKMPVGKWKIRKERIGGDRFGSH